jgi:tetratricopeptide (TPR) repeat protein
MKSTLIAAFIFASIIFLVSVCHAKDLCYDYIEMKRYDDAIKECTDQIKGETAVDDIGIAYTNRGIAYAGKGQYDQAIDDYTAAIRATPKYEKAYFNRGNAYYAKGKYNEAVDDYNKAIELNPGNPYPYYNMACIYAMRACSMLKQSVKNGFKDWKLIKEDKDLDNIRNSSCYREIMKGK